MVVSGQDRYRSMAKERNSKTEPGQPMVYQIRLRGHLSRGWADWFGGVALTLEDNGETRLTCPVVDQAALYGLLRKVRDLSLPLVSVTRVQSGEAGGSDVKPHLEPSSLERDKQDEPT